jgi:predicted GH43/DUF377 family glycosyl hydrolase
MKRFISISVILFSLFLNSCTTENPVSSDTQKGGITLNIDRAHKPANVVEITATLTRENHDPVIGTLNLLSDTTAQITMNDLAAGSWHLKVDAADEDSEVVYTGEKDVEILAGITTQVYLTLVPTGAGEGNIYIYVTWGVPASSDWIDYAYNPVLTSQNNYWDYNGVWQGKVLYDNGIYKMWYMGLADNAEGNIGYAESVDGNSWTYPFSDPVLAHGNYGDWDAVCVSPGTITKNDGIYKLYYYGFADQYSNWSIGLATSEDGINWTKYPDNPILSGTSGWEYQIAATSIIKVDSVYYLYYYGKNSPVYKIGLATSMDGINWTKYSGNPILSATEPWENSGVYYPSVIREDEQFIMVYSNVNPNSAFGMATSSDGINWIKKSGNPFFEKENTANNWGIGSIGYPWFMKLNNEYRIYYSGTLPDNVVHRIGFVKKSY